jgi:hypothetical protein
MQTMQTRISDPAHPHKKRAESTQSERIADFLLHYEFYALALLELGISMRTARLHERLYST